MFKRGLENDVHAPTECLYMHIPLLDALFMPPDFLSTEQLDYGRGQLKYVSTYL